MVLLPAQGPTPKKIAEVGIASEDRVGDVIHSVNDDGFASPPRKYVDGPPQKFTPL